MILNNARVYSITAELVTVVQNGTLSIRVSNQAMTVQIFNCTTASSSKLVFQIAGHSSRPRLRFFSLQHNGICESLAPFVSRRFRKWISRWSAVVEPERARMLLESEKAWQLYGESDN